MHRLDAQFATDPDGLVYLLDDRDKIVWGPVDPTDETAWSELTDFVRGYLLDSR